MPLYFKPIRCFKATCKPDIRMQLGKLSFYIFPMNLNFVAPPTKMLGIIKAQGELRSLLAATPPLGTNILVHSISQAGAKTRPNPIFSLPSLSLPVSPKRSNIWQRLHFFHNSCERKNKPTSPKPGSPSRVAVEAEPQALGARMRKLFREYGWSAAGVYFTLSVLDIPLCYLLVKTLGTDKIGE